MNSIKVGMMGGGLVLPSFEDVHLPLGISFFVFQAVSYLIDVYRNESPVEKNPFNVALYISMFPQLVAGPIVRFHSIARELHERGISWGKVNSGIAIFVMGLAQKVLLANTVAVPVDAIYALPADQLTQPVAWLATVGYSLQIYYDFAGYSNMAIGLGLALGFHFPRNFDHPYCSLSITEFWRRWHMSLSRWFRDYLYIPLGGNRCGPWRTYFNLWVVFVLCGLWHGASWNFLVWGVTHGLFLVFERAGFSRVLESFSRPVRNLYCLFVVFLAWIPFRAETLEKSVGMIKALFVSHASPQMHPLAQFMNAKIVLALFVGLVLAYPVFTGVRKHLASETGEISQGRGWRVCRGIGLLALFFVCTVVLSSGAHNPFIYFNF